MNLPPDVPLGSAESRRLLREMAVGLIALSEGALAKEDSLLRKEVAKVVKAESATVPVIKPPIIALPKDVPAKSSEARRLRRRANATSNGLIGKRIYRAPIKRAKFKPRFDNEPMSTARVG